MARKARPNPRRTPASAPAPTGPPVDIARPDSRRNIAILLGVVALMFLPFVGRAFHVDDPLFIWAAKHIQTSPFHPYDFIVNWYGVEQPMSIVTENPPVASYFLAIAGAFAGITEISSHLAFLIPVLASVFGMYLLARRFCGDAVLAAAISAFTPVFVVSGLTVMSDSLMLAFWIFAVYAWLVGLDRNSHFAFAVASLLIVLAALTKYFGIALIPLLVVYSTMRQRPPARWLIWMAVPVIALFAFETAAHQMYGHGFLFGAAKYATGTHVGYGRLTPSKLAVTLAFFGGCLASIAFLAHRLWSRSQLVAGVVLALATTAIVSMSDQLGSRALPETTSAKVVFAAQLGIWMAAGTGVVALAISDLRRERSAESWFLLLWVMGTMLFAGVFNWTVNGRTILPMVAPIGMLVVRRLERQSPAGSTLRLAHLAPSLVAALALTSAVAWADTRLANVIRDGANQITTEFSSVRRIWFEGHWGFQYYMEQRGAKPLYLSRAAVDATSSSPWALAPGDLIVIPGTNTNITPIPKEWFTFKKFVYLPSTGWLATMNIPMGAGFYSDEFGALPFAFGKVDPEQFILLDVIKPVPAGR